jgi:hypothetical protein
MLHKNYEVGVDFAFFKESPLLMLHTNCEVG